MAYRGVFSGITQPEKYIGDITKITYRSMWERSLMVWLDACPAVSHWSSENFIVEYYDPVQSKARRYYVDFYLRLSDGREILVEVKPHKETEPPKQGTRRTAKFLTECKTFETNQAKWEAARKMAEYHGMKFEIWTEHHLKKLGVVKEFTVGNKTLMRAERRAMPGSKYNPQNKVRRTKTTPKRRS